MYEWAEVEKVIDGHGEGKWREYLVEWRDGGDREWVKAAWVAEDLVSDFEAGLEYAAARPRCGGRAQGREDGEGGVESMTRGPHLSLRWRLRVKNRSTSVKTASPAPSC